MARASAWPGAGARRHLLPLSGFVVLTGLALWPAVTHFRSRMLSEPSGDSSVFTWAWWAIPRSLERGESPFRTDQLFHPVGVDLSLTTTAPLVGLVTWPVRAALGPVAQVNVVQLFAFFFAAVTAYFLALHVAEHRGAAFIAGAAFAAAPYRWAQLPGHLNLIHTWCIPLGLLALLRFAERPSPRRAVALGAAVGLAFLLDPQLCVLLVTGLVLLMAVRVSELWPHRRLVLLAGGVALVVAAPLLVPMASAVRGGELDPPPGDEAAEHFSATAASWVVHPADHPLFGAIAERRPPASTPEAAAAPGLLLLGLAVAGGRFVDRRRRRGWVALTVTGVLLSLGPYADLPTGGRVPLPYLALRAVPGLDALRVPGRFAILGVLGVAVLAAGSIAAVAERRPDRSRLIVALVAIISGIELLRGPLPDGPGQVPDVYTAIADDDGTGAVLELPLQWSTGQAIVGDDDANHTVFMYYATVHGRPLVNGSASRFPSTRLGELESQPVYRELLAAEGEPGITGELTFDEADLTRLGIGYVVYHRDRPVPAVWRHLRSLDLPVLADDGTILVWRVRPAGR